MPADDSGPLRPTLERATSTLKTALDEACSADVERADTGELIRIEEVLAIANEAAKEAISVRRRLAVRPESDSLASGASGDGLVSREINDARGMRWAVFAVHPTIAGGRPSVRERFRDGWLAFDSGVETRRLAPIPEGWSELPQGALLALCERAEAVPRRARPRG